MTDELKTPESVTPESKPETEQHVEMVEKTKLDEVVRESIARKGRIKELEAQLEKFSSLAADGKTPDEALASFNSQIAQLRAENTRMKHIGILRDELQSRGVLDARIADLVYSDPKAQSVVGTDVLGAYLDQWKQDNQIFFKHETAPSPVKPVDGSQTIVLQPDAMTPDKEYEAYMKLPVDERIKDPVKMKQMSELRMKLASKQS